MRDIEKPFLWAHRKIVIRTIPELVFKEFWEKMELKKPV